MKNNASDKKLNTRQKNIKERENYIDYLEKLTIAHSNVLLLSDEERKVADRTIKAYEMLQQLSEHEQKEKDTLLKAHDNLMNLSSSELMHKNLILKNILEINQYISTIIQEEFILRKTLENMIKALEFDKGILFLRKIDKISAKIFINIKQEDTKKEYFKFSLKTINNVIHTKKGVFIKNKKIKLADKDSLISIICIPLISKKQFLGIIYIDTIGKITSLSKSDIEIAEIFGTQATISLTNVILYKLLKQQTITDKFTGLPNRKKLEIDLETPGAKTLALLNIDAFSSINTAYGIDVGNYVLKTIAQRLLEICTAKTKVYKLSADEFVILSTDKELTPYMLKSTIRNLLSNTTIKYKEIYINIVLSIGLVHNEEQNLLRKADIALKVARERGRGKMVIYNDNFNMINKYKETFYWANKLKDAIHHDKLVPYFQAIHNNKTKNIDIYECLARIIDNGKVIAPKNFIEASKQIGLYSTVSYCMIDKCFNYFKDKEIEFSINLSREDFSNMKLIEYIEYKIKKNGIDPQRIIFEVLEEFSLKSDPYAFEFVKNLKSLGVKIAIDDFGSEYSNFSRLLSIKTDYIKIAGTFISYIDKDQNIYKIVKAMTDFAHSLNARVVAEYVDAPALQQKIEELGIEYSQGNLFSAPLPQI